MRAAYKSAIFNFDGTFADTKTRELFLILQAIGMKTGIVSWSKPADVRALIKMAQVDDLIVKPTRKTHGNTAPKLDIIESALKNLKTLPSETIMLGDTPDDINAATKAGVKIIAFRSGGWNDRALKGALKIYDDIEDLLFQFGQSPLVESVSRTQFDAPFAFC